MKDIKPIAPEKRLKAYKKAKEIYSENVKNAPQNGWCGLCWCLDHALDEACAIDTEEYYDLLGLLPEWETQRKKYNPDMNKAYWWNLEDAESRFKCLDRMIRNVKRKIKSDEN